MKKIIAIVLFMMMFLMTACSSPKSETIDYVPLNIIDIDAQINNGQEIEIEKVLFIQNEDELELLINNIDFQRGSNFFKNISNLTINNFFHDYSLIVLAYTTVGAPLILAEENKGNIIFHIINTEQYDYVTEDCTLFFAIKKNLIDNELIKYSFEIEQVDSQILMELKGKYE